MYEQLLLVTRPFQDAFNSCVSASGRLIVVFVVFLFLVSARPWHRSSHAHPTPAPSQSSLTGQMQNLLPTSKEERHDASGSVEPPVLIYEIIPEQPSIPAGTEKDQTLAKIRNLKTELSECKSWNDRLRARLNGRDAKVAKLQIQLMEIPMRETLDLQLKQKEKTIKAIGRQLQTQRDDCESVSRAQQETLRELDIRDELHASAVAVLKSTYHAKIKTNQVQHEIDVQHMQTCHNAKVIETDQRATQASWLKRQALNRCEELEAKVIEIQISHAELVKRDQRQELERKREQTELFEGTRSLRESESLLRDRIEILNEMVNTRDENIEELRRTVSKQTDQQERTVDPDRIDFLEEMIKSRDEDVDNLKRTTTEQKDQQELARYRAYTTGRHQAAVILEIYVRMTKKRKTLTESRIKSLQDKIGQRTAEIQASEVAHAKALRKEIDDKNAQIQALEEAHVKALAQALQSQMNCPETNSVKLDVALKQLTECQNKLKRVQTDWEGAHIQVSEMVQLLCDEEKRVHDKTAEFEAEKGRSRYLEERLEFAQRRIGRGEERPKGLQTIEEEKPQDKSPQNRHNNVPEKSSSLHDPMKNSAAVTIGHVEISSGKKHDALADGSEEPRARAIDWSKVNEREGQRQCESRGSSRNSSKRPRQTAQDVKKIIGQLPEWLDLVKLREDVQKEAAEKVASLELRLRERMNGSKKVGHEPQKEGSEISPHRSERHEKDKAQTPHDGIWKESPSRNNNRGRGHGENRHGGGRGRGTDNNRGSPGRGRVQSGWTR